MTPITKYRARVRARAGRLAGAVVLRVPRWVWPAFELVIVGAVAVAAGWSWLELWRLSVSVGLPVSAVWPVLIALPAGALARLTLDARRNVTRYCNRRDALLDGWCSSDG